MHFRYMYGNVGAQSAFAPPSIARCAPKMNHPARFRARCSGKPPHNLLYWTKALPAPLAQERNWNAMKIGFWELVVIVVVAFVFIGPDQLPVYAQKLGKMLRELKKYTGAASEEIQKNVVEPLNEIQAPLKEAVAPLTDIKKDIDNSVKDVTKSFTGIGKTSKEEAAKAEQAEEVTELEEVEELEDTAPAAKPEEKPAEAAPATETAEEKSAEEPKAEEKPTEAAPEAAPAEAAEPAAAPAAEEAAPAEEAKV